MYSLLIDTHDKYINLVIYKDGKTYKEVHKESLKAHSIYVMPLIKQLLDDNNISKDIIEEIIVVNGPGSFTGVRIGITIAKTWAYCRNIPIKEVSSLELLAVSVAGNNKTVGISDPKGYYIGKFNEDNQKIEEYKYISKTECDLDNIILEENTTINYYLLYEYVATLNAINPHDVKPIYIKQIGVEND